MKGAEAIGQRRLVVGADGPRRDEAQRIAAGLDDAPAGPSKARVDADDANRLMHAATITPQSALGILGPAVRKCQRRPKAVWSRAS